MKIRFFLITVFLAFNNATINSSNLIKGKEYKQINWEELEAKGITVIKDSTRNTIIANSAEEIEELKRQGFTFIRGAKDSLLCDYYFPSDALSDSTLTHLFCNSNSRWIAVHKTNDIPKYGIISDNFGNVIDTVLYFIEGSVSDKFLANVRMPNQTVVSITNILTGKTFFENAMWSSKDPYGGTLPPQLTHVLVKDGKPFQVDCERLVSGYYFVSTLCPEGKGKNWNVAVFHKK